MVSKRFHRSSPVRQAVMVLMGIMTYVALPTMAQAPPQAGALLAPITAKLGLLSERAAYFAVPDRQLFESVHDAFLDLQRGLERNGRAIPVDYVDLLQAYEQVLPAVEDLTNKDRAPEARQQLLDLKADLDVKNRFLASGMGAASFSKELLVLVEVRTRAQGMLVTGYEVMARPVALPPNWKPLPFSSPTNDARRNLAPGIYQFTFSLGQQVLRKVVEVGEDGLPTQTILQEVPP